MSESFSGTIEAMRKDRKGVKIAGKWYSARNASVFGDAEKGDTVSGTFTKNGEWINCDEASIKVTKGSSGGGGGGGGSGGASKGDQFRSRTEIIRTTSLESSIKFHSLDNSGTYKDDIERVLKTSELFVAYVTGLIDVGALGAAASAAPAPEPEPEPEPEPVVEPSALSNFLGT